MSVSNLPAKLDDKTEMVIMQGDLSRLSADERLAYVNNICQTLGLNPLTRPFDYITFQGKLTLYARKDCAEQLRKIHGVGITDLKVEVLDGICVVRARAKDRTGKEDESTGAVNIEGLKGEAKANAMMKAETKAKRRVTLSICGLGILDESEVQDADDVTPPSEPGQFDSGAREKKITELVEKFRKIRVSEQMIRTKFSLTEEHTFNDLTDEEVDELQAIGRAIVNDKKPVREFFPLPNLAPGAKS